MSTEAIPAYTEGRRFYKLRAKITLLSIGGHLPFLVKICNVQITFLIAREDKWADKWPGSLTRDKDNGIVNKQASNGKRDSDSFLPHFSKTIRK